MSLKLERELVKVPYPHLRLVGTRSNCMMTIASRPDLVACFWKVEVLYKLDSPFNLLPDDPLALPLRGALLSEPGGEGRRGRGGVSVDSVDLDRAGVR